MLEIWCRDYTTIEYEETDKDGKNKVTKRKYPRGRVLTIAPELNLLLDDKKTHIKMVNFHLYLLKIMIYRLNFGGR